NGVFRANSDRSRKKIPFTGFWTDCDLGCRYVKMQGELDELGVSHKLVVIPSAKHGQWGREPWKTPFENAMLEFLRSR
ncbi:hypothetical protein OAL00_05690, partial [Verrucomicrobiales bacterium]|nr:hypothetical protein [Verrucomicrobiales bacterium]